MKRRPFLLDANLLVLFLVGTASRSLITKHKKLTSFSIADYDILLDILAAASNIIVTPNTLTEASNLSAYIAEPARTSVLGVLREFCGTASERYVPSGAALQRPEFIQLGLTDAALIETTGQGEVLLTTDFTLYQRLLAEGKHVVNFHHVRQSFLRE